MKISSKLEKKINENVFNLLIDNGFSKDPFSIKQEDLWRIDNVYHRFDICIYKNNQILALIEIAPNSQWMNAKKPFFPQWLEKTNATYGIITDGEKFLLKTKNGKTENFKQKNFDSLLRILKRKQRLSKSQEKIKKCAEIIKKFKLGSPFQKAISLNKDNQICFIENNELLFFKSLLSLEKNKKTIYRYISLKSLFSTLKENKYRMCGLAGMNDKTEKDYFDNYIGQSSEVENNIFISSCSLLKDDLTMWRLYGDDGKGVCLAFEIQKNISKEFNLLKIDYGNNSKKHEKIDLLKELLSCNFLFKDLNKWKHFFKGFEYKKEREIRLLFYYNTSSNSIEKNWVITDNNNIINPVVDFPLNEDFPLKLKSIRLGPKFPELILNKNQLKEMLNDKNLQKIKVYKSKITSYR